MADPEFISVGKKVNGKKNKTPHPVKVGLNLTNAQIKEAMEKRQRELTKAEK